MAPTAVRGGNSTPSLDFETRFRLLTDQHCVTERVWTRLKTAKTEAHAIYQQHGHSVPVSLDERRFRQMFAQHAALEPLTLIVHNIDLPWLKTLGSLFDADERVFLIHLWNATLGSEEPLHKPLDGAARTSQSRLPYTNRFWTRRCIGGAQPEMSALCLSFAVLKPTISKSARADFAAIR